MVTETVGMIIHIPTVEEKDTILRLGHKPIPFISRLGRISSYFEHPM